MVVLIFLFVSCSNNKKQPLSNSSPSPYIHSYTSGSISTDDPIVVQFTKEIDTTIKPKSFFSIHPSVQGEMEWKDSKTLLFIPQLPLKQNHTYNVRILVNKILKDISSNHDEFTFQFKTLKQNVEVITEPIRFYDSRNAKLNGQILTADVASLEAVKKVITASQEGTDLEIKWETPKSKTLFEFSIQNIQTSNSDVFVQLQIDGNSIGVEKKETKSIKVPATNAFKVLSSRVVGGTENYISVTFSNPLHQKQNLDGFIKISDKKVKGVIDGNELKIFLRNTATKELDLQLFKGIKNSSGVPLQQNYSTTLRMAQTKPQVRFTVENNKAILPSSNESIIPFDAIGLKAVKVSVVKVFTNNILQYLQTNRLGGTEQLLRVAQPIATKTIDLSNLGVTNFEQWNTFSLNLSDIMTVDPGALYQVKIGFKQKHSLYQCPDKKLKIDELDDEQIWDAEETSNWDSYESYYSTNFQWEQRDNPCHESYYGDRRSIKKLFLASDLGIIAKRSDHGALSVFVTDLIDTSPLENVEISLYDFQRQLLNDAYTDNQGMAKIKVPKGKPFVLVAKKDDQTGYLKVDEYSSLSLSNFDISGTKVRQGLKGFIYGERGVWRPSDTIHLTFILGDHKNTLPQEHPVIMELYDPNGRLAYRKVNDTPVGSMYRFDFATEEEAVTGNWSVKARVGAATFEKRIRVETVKPNRLKINLEPIKKRLTYRDRFFKGHLNVSWLTGAKARNLKAEYEMLITPVKTVFKGYPNYVFDDKSRPFFSQRNIVFQGNLDDQGNSLVNIDLGDNKNAPGALNVMLFGKVYEEGGDFSISKSQIPFFPFESFVGLKLPDGDKRGMLLTNKKHTINLATVSADAKPISKGKLKISLYKLNWRWWWDKSHDNLSSYLSSSHRQPEYTYYAATKNGKGTCTVEVKNSNWGRYYLQAEDLESGHISGQIVYFDWPGWAGKGKGELDGASMLDFSVGKEEYGVGEEVSISIPSTKGNRILVSIETGKDILESFWVNTEEKRTQIKFKTTTEMAPNVYVHLTMIQPHNQSKNDLPIRLYGIKSLKVVDEKTRLYPVVELPKVLKPEKTFTVKVREENGNPMNYTLAIVEDGLLDLTNFSTPNPWDLFYSKEALSVKTWDLYDNVMNAFASKNTFMTTIGGDGELVAKDEIIANRFKPVVKFLGPFSLKKGEAKSHSVTMPQYLGSVRTMVIGATKNAYGSTEKTSAVKQDLMVLATMPRVAGPGETIKLPVNIFSLSNQIKDVQIKVEVSGALQSVGATTKQIRFEKEGDQVVYFDVKALNTVGVGKIRVKASSGMLASTYDIEMKVIPRNPFVSIVASNQVVTKETPWEYNYTPLGLKGKNEAVLEISSMPALNLEHRLDYLIQYPHGCVEQLVSSVFPQLYLDALVSLSDVRKKEIQGNISRAIFKLGRFQTSEGGFAYWSGGQIPSEWGSTYAGHFLVEAKNLGYAVPETLLNSWIDFQTKRTNNWTLTSEANDLTQAYRLYTLALAKKPSISAMNRMKEETRISETAKWRLALAYATAGFGLQAKKLIENLEQPSDSGYDTNHFRYTFGSRLRDQAMVLETLTTLFEKDEAYELLKRIADKVGSTRWMSTQTTAYSLMAISKFIKQNPIDKEIDVTLTVNGTPQRILNSDRYLQQITLSEPEKNATLSITKSDNTSLFLRFIKKGIPLENNSLSKKSNLNFSVEYFDTSDNPIDISTLPKGTNFYAYVKISNPGRMGKYSELALTQIFPSGWEIINTRLDETESSEDALKHKDIRDDRVMHYFDLAPNKEATFKILLNATYEGKYYLPMVNVEAMYDNSIYANKSGKWVQVVSEGN